MTATAYELRARRAKGACPTSRSISPAALGRVVACYPSAPAPARVAIYPCGSAATGRPAEDRRCDFGTRSIARSQSCEDYRDVSEKRAPTGSSPPPSAPDFLGAHRHATHESCALMHARLRKSRQPELTPQPSSPTAPLAWRLDLFAAPAFATQGERAPQPAYSS